MKPSTYVRVAGASETHQRSTVNFGSIPSVQERAPPVNSAPVHQNQDWENRNRS